MRLHFNYHGRYKEPSVLMVWETGSTQGAPGVIREDEVGPGQEWGQEPWQDQPSFSAAFEDTASRLGAHWKEGETGGSRNLCTCSDSCSHLGALFLPENSGPSEWSAWAKPGG